VGKNKQGRKEREPFSNLPCVPVSEKMPRKSESKNDKENRQSKRSEKNGVSKSHKETKPVKSKESKPNSEKVAKNSPEKSSKRQSIEPLEKTDYRKYLEEKSKKYSHLPVYDKEEEKRKAQALQAKMSGIFSEMDKQLESVTDLTSTHMAKKGITMNTSPTPFDDTSDDGEPTAEVHTIRYNKGVLKPRYSASQTQGSQNKDQNKITSVSKTETSVDKCEKQTINEKGSEKFVSTVTSETRKETSKIADVQSETAKAEPVYALPPYKRNNVPVKQLSESKDGATYESLGHTFRELTEKMQTVTKDIKTDQEIPFMDDGDSDDYRQAVRKSTDLDSDTDIAILEALGECLDQHQQVEKIQLEVGPSSSSTSLMVSERMCHGTDTIHMSKRTVRRDYTDI